MGSPLVFERRAATNAGINGSAFTHFVAEIFGGQVPERNTEAYLVAPLHPALNRSISNMVGAANGLIRGFVINLTASHGLDVKNTIGDVLAFAQAQRPATPATRILHERRNYPVAQFL